jgi:hypothetical protein
MRFVMFDDQNKLAYSGVVTKFEVDYSFDDDASTGAVMLVDGKLDIGATLPPGYLVDLLYFMDPKDLKGT